MSSDGAAAAAAGSGLDAYEVVCAIGRGSFGSVSKVVRKADGRVLVWKELCYGGACVRAALRAQLAHAHVQRRPAHDANACALFASAALPCFAPPRRAAPRRAAAPPRRASPHLFFASLSPQPCASAKRRSW